MRDLIANDCNSFHGPGCVARTLHRNDYVVDYRVKAGIRVSPHFYNTFDEIDAIMDEMARIVKERDYDLDEPFASVVT